MILILASCFLQITAQNSINDYKYVIVEKQFHFQNEANEYNLNELTRFLLKKKGFKPILESDIYPDDLKSNYCLALQSEVKAKGMLRTTVTITLKDCNNNILFTADGSTKEKDFDKVYAYAIRKAFEDFSVVEYNYVPNEAVSGKNKEIKPTKDDSDEVEKLKAEIDELKKKNSEKESKLNETNAKKLVEKPSSKKEARKSKSKKASIYLEAVDTDNGFNLVDSDSKKLIHALVKTGIDNVYTVKGNNGIVYKKEGKWIREYTKGKKTLIETLNVVFQ